MTIYHVTNLHLKSLPYGNGLFCHDPIPQNTKILTPQFPLLSSEELPKPYREGHDSFLQIGINLYMGPFTGLELNINHSCDPSAAFIIKDKEVVFTSIRDIAPGDQITCDYSITMCDDDWELTCLCESPNCRGTIREFKFLPQKEQNKYREMGIVPYYQQGTGTTSKN